MNATRFALFALALVACAHPKPAEVVSAVEAPTTIAYYLTVDTARLPGAASGDEAAQQALAALIEAHLATVGQPRGVSKSGDHLDVVADLPAPGYALRARITAKGELLCSVALEPLANDQPITVAPFSVHSALAELRRGLSALTPPRRPAMPHARFVRLREQASAAAHAGRDRAMPPEEYVRVPRAISNEGEDAPYPVPPPLGGEMRQVP